jgi:hypothetical protein
MRSRRRFPLAAGLVLSLVATAGLVLVLVLRDDPVTVEGRDVPDPGAVLATAEGHLDRHVRARHGARSEDARCWFHLQDAGGSDVRDALVCGPVLFVDGDPGRSWLRFPVTATRTDGEVRLTVAEEPAAPDPGRRPDADLLRRPGGGTPPEGSGGLTPPEPVRAEPGLRTTGPVPGVALAAPAGPARLSGPAAAVTITGLARPERVGSGDVARRPAEGERFLAVAYRFDAGEGTSTERPEAGYEVPGREPLLLDPALLVPGTTITELLSVPTGADDVDLVVRDAGLEQRLSLLTGAPGPDNVVVLGRVNRRVELGATAELPAVAGGPGSPARTVRFTVVVGAAQLRYSAGGGTPKLPGGRDRAFLVVDATMALPGRAPVAVPPAMLTVTLPGGTMVPAVDLADDPGVVQPAFDVPGDFTDGVLAVSGIAGYPDGAFADLGSARLDVPVAIPPG